MSLGERDARRELCEELARGLTEEGGLRLVRLLHLCGLLKSPDNAEILHPVLSTPGEGRPQPISIWQPIENDGEVSWQRPEPSPLGDHYASRRRLAQQPEAGRQRVVFLGESVAAGYLLAPWHTPAQVLAGHLNSDEGLQPWEVIDLARTNERLASMVDTFEAALQLNPQVAVFFAGNNWPLLETAELSPYAPAVRWRQRVGLGLRSGGLSGPVELASKQLARQVRSAMARVARLASGAGVKVVLVLPEVNLADWPARQPVAWLAGGASASWYGLYSRALQALDEGRWAEAARLAREMVAMDGGSNPTGHRLLAQAHLLSGESERPAGRGAREAAAEACRCEVEADAYSVAAFLPSPRATRAVRALMRQAAREHGFGTVDLPEVFAHHASDPLPGRRMFLDYCHLTTEGIEVAMAATASAVLRAGGERKIDWQQILLRAAVPRPSPKVEAVARLGAAIHTAHRLAGGTHKAELLRHWCREALRAWPGIAATMAELAHARCAPVPELLSAAQQKMLAAPVADGNPAVLGFQHGWSWPALDGELFAAMIAVLRHGEVAQPRAAEEIERAILTHRAVGRDRPLELAVPPFYLAEPVERFYAEAMAALSQPGRSMLRCVWPETEFDLPWDGQPLPTQSALWLRATLRLPTIAGLAERPPATLRLELNGHPVGEAILSPCWSRQEFELPVAHLHQGLNRLRLAWPPLPGEGEAALAAAGERLEAGLEADLHPLFGEIHSLRVSVEASAVHLDDAP